MARETSELLSAPLLPNLDVCLPRKPKPLESPVPFKPLNIPSNLPSTIDSWTYSQVIQFIVHVLSLPKALENDIREFILNKRINGKKLANLGEGELAKLGFNKLWSHNLAAAIDELTFKGILCESPMNFCPTSPKFKSKEKRNHLKVSASELVPGNLPTLDNAARGKSQNSRRFSIPKLESTLVRHYMLSETAVMKEELGRLKRELNTRIEPIPECEKSSDKYSSDDKKLFDIPEEADKAEDWGDYAVQALTMTTIVATISLVGLISLKSSFKK